MRKAKVKPPMQVRLTADLEAKVCEYQKRVKSEMGFDISLSKIVHSLIEKGLEVSSRAALGNLERLKT